MSKHSANFSQNILNQIGAVNLNNQQSNYTSQKQHELPNRKSSSNINLERTQKDVIIRKNSSKNLLAEKNG